jgi:hypothetical protein
MHNKIFDTFLCVVQPQQSLCGGEQVTRYFSTASRKTLFFDEQLMRDKNARWNRGKYRYSKSLIELAGNFLRLSGFFCVTFSRGQLTALIVYPSSVRDFHRTNPGGRRPVPATFRSREWHSNRTGARHTPSR